MRFGIAVVVATLLVPGVQALAQSETPAKDDAADSGRYSFTRSGEDFVRTDRISGQVSLCAQRTAGWACQPVPEERAALESEIARLADENASLRQRLAAANPEKPEARPEKKPQSKGYRVPDAQIRLPTNEDIDRAVEIMGRVWKRLVQMLNDTRNDIREKI